MEAGSPIRGDRTWLADGETPIAAHDWPPLVDGLPPGNGLTRPKLHEILTSRTLESGADVRTGVTFTELVAGDDDHVDVTFTDGERRSYDLVVGADGLYSKVREHLFGSDLGRASPARCAGGTTCPGSRASRRSGCSSVPTAAPASSPSART